MPDDADTELWLYETGQVNEPLYPHWKKPKVCKNKCNEPLAKTWKYYPMCGVKV